MTNPTWVAARCEAIDGDTLRCGRERIRLIGIDTAELAGHCRRGKSCARGDPVAQRAALARLAQQGPMLIQRLTEDRYGRTLAIVKSARGTDASCAALRSGATYVARWDHNGYVARACRVYQKR